jgi:glycosyltransferase involved in cell wall biosynthesis
MVQVSMNNSTSPSIAHEANATPLPFAEHIRAQFEGLRRQPELAADMMCFHPGEQLSSIHYIAHPHGLHVARWLKVLSHTQARVTIETANPVPEYSGEFVSARPVVPGMLKIPMMFRYLLAGLLLRFSPSNLPAGVIHAHCASGNGLMAWLSGRRYLIGTYGSEIYSAHQRSFVYRWFLKKILQRAERISDCSAECTRVLREQFDIAPEKIYSFHLGYDEKHFHPLNRELRMQRRRGSALPVEEPVWVISRRTDPHYRTQDVVRGFLDFCQANSRGHLVVLCGDHQPLYTQTIREVVRSHAQCHRITIVEQMLNPQGFASWLQLSDFSISVPRTDNFSISILESMGCGAVPVLADLAAYNPLKSCPAVRWMTQFKADDFTTMFCETAALWPAPHDRCQAECLEFVQDGYSTEGAIRDIAAFYLGHPLPSAKAIRRAA